MGKVSIVVNPMKTTIVAYLEPFSVCGKEGWVGDSRKCLQKNVIDETIFFYYLITVSCKIIVSCHVVAR